MNIQLEATRYATQLAQLEEQAVLSVWPKDGCTIRIVRWQVAHLAIQSFITSPDVIPNDTKPEPNAVFLGCCEYKLPRWEDA